MGSHAGSSAPGSGPNSGSSYPGGGPPPVTYQ
jgi:hypothetical protein